MSASEQLVTAPSKALMFMELRALHEFGASLGLLPLLRNTPRGDGHPVLVFPGLAASDTSTRPLRAFLWDRGYAVSGWQHGRNYGLQPGIEQGLMNLVRRLTEQHGCKLSLVGWSLGGLFARHLAKVLPEHTRSVITLASPFAGSPKSTNMWRLYEYTSGQRVSEHDDHPVGPLAATPPVPTTAMFSRTDGICAWRSCVEKTGPQSESIEIRGSHAGMAHNPAVLYAIADRLAQPEGRWEPFHRRGWRAAVFPDPTR